jgi:hypothetical protein
METDMTDKVWTLTWTWDDETTVEIYATREDALWGFKADGVDPSDEDLLELHDTGICQWGGDDRCVLEEVTPKRRPTL